MNVLPNNAALDYYKVADMLRRKLNAVMAEVKEYKASKYPDEREEMRKKALIRAEECRDTLSEVLIELYARYYELQPDK